MKKRPKASGLVSRGLSLKKHSELWLDVPFWVCAGVILYLCALGCFTPFYKLVYALPFGGTLRAIGDSWAMGAIDACLAWGLLIAGALLMVGRLVRPAAAFGVIYLALMYVLNPPHFGHTGESHFMYIDRNVIEIVMLFCVMAWRRREKPDGEEA